MLTGKMCSGHKPAFGLLEKNIHLLACIFYLWISLVFSMFTFTKCIYNYLILISCTGRACWIEMMQVLNCQNTVIICLVQLNLVQEHIYIYLRHEMKYNISIFAKIRPRKCFLNSYSTDLIKFIFVLFVFSAILYKSISGETWQYERPSSECTCVPIFINPQPMAGT
jgi:hypothetical protein